MIYFTFLTPLWDVCTECPGLLEGGSKVGVMILYVVALFNIDQNSVSVDIANDIHIILSLLTVANISLSAHNGSGAVLKTSF